MDAVPNSPVFELPDAAVDPGPAGVMPEDGAVGVADDAAPVGVPVLPLIPLAIDALVDGIVPPAAGVPEDPIYVVVGVVLGSTDAP